MLAPYLSSGRLTVLLRHQPIAADHSRDFVRSVRLRNLESGKQRVLHAAYFLDATEQGDLLPLTKTEFVTGSESRSQTGEPHAPDRPQPANIQACTYCFGMDYRPGEDHTIDRPESYSFWKNYVQDVHPSWLRRLSNIAVEGAT